MSDPWLSIIGLGEDGLSGLSDASREALQSAEIIFGGPRHLALTQAGDRGEPWPVPFSVDPVLAHRGRKVVLLASGDPFWFGAGGSIVARLKLGEWWAAPAPSTFALAASRLGWKLEEIHCMGLHAAPLARLRPVLSNGVRAICLLRDGAAVNDLADWLVKADLGASRLVVLESLGGPRERVRHDVAEGFSIRDAAYPVAVAVEAAGPGGLSRASGLPDDAFHHDGQITKRPVRALTLSALAPRPGQRLWDIGAGSGSISVEWCLAARNTTAFALETRADRLTNIRSNIDDFGLSHRMAAHLGHAPAALDDLPDPDTVFIGGGCTDAVLAAVWARLGDGGRLVVNAVTLETEALLLQSQASFGGSLLRAEIAEAAPLGRLRGWNRARPILQWSVTR